jgi:hypothetical protein
MAQLVGAKQLRSRFKAVEKAPKGMMRELGLRAVSNQKHLSPVRTGNLRRTIHLDSASATEAVTVASAKYASAVEFGTGPHIIRPKRRKVLRFKTGGSVIFARFVNHPGTRAQPFMVPGARKALDDMGVKAIVKAWNGAA